MSPVMDGADDPSTPPEFRRNRNSQASSEDPTDTRKRVTGSARSSGSCTANHEDTPVFVGRALTRHEDENSAELRKENVHVKEMVEGLKEECHQLESFGEYWKYRYDHVVDVAIRPYAESKHLAFDEFTESSVNTIRRLLLDDALQTEDLHHHLHSMSLQIQDTRDELVASQIQCLSLEEQNITRQAELQDLVQNLGISQSETQKIHVQMRALQKEMLANVSKVQAVSDETFSRDFHALASSIRSLGRSVVPAQGVDVLEILQPSEFLEKVGKHQWNTRARKKAYVEAWIWCALISYVFLNPFTFFGKIAKNLDVAWTCIFGEEHGEEWPDPSPDSEAWRLNTVKNLLKQIGRETVAEGQTGGKNWHANRVIGDLQESVLEMRAATVNTIKGNLEAISPKADLVQISDIVNQASTLAMNLSLQRCRLQVTYPDIGERFEPDGMSAVPDRNGHDIREGVVAFVVNPGLTKWGDANGNHLEEWYEIVPSLVQLEPC